VQSEATDALNAYDPPTKAELDSAVAALATSAALATVDGIVDAILEDTSTTLPAAIASVSADIADVPSAADNATAAAAAILETPANLLKTDASGRVEVSGTKNTLDSLSGADGDTLKTLSDQIDGVGAGAGLSAQDVADALKLAPTAGAPAAGSVYAELNAVPSAADIKTALEADGGKLDHVWEMTEDDAGVRRLTANALEQAPGTDAASVAAAILADPANLLLTDASGRVEIAGATNNTLDALLTAVQGTDGDTLKTLSDQIDSVGAGAGLNAQEVRDAMKLAPSAGAAADGSIDNLLAALPAAVEAALSGYQVIVQSAVSTDGQITVYQGYDYAAADDRAIEFEVATPDFTGATTALKFDGDTYAGAVVNPGLTTQLLRFEFTAVQTAAMTAGYHAYRLEVTRAGRLLLEETGVINVKE